MNCAALPGVVVRALPFPNYFVPEIFLAKDFIHDGFEIMALLRIEMNVDAAVVSQ